MRYLIFFSLSLAILPCLAADPPSATAVYREFQDPPRTYSVRPFWFWNGLLHPDEVDRQIREMVSQHVHGAYVQNRPGLPAQPRIRHT